MPHLCQQYKMMTTRKPFLCLTLLGLVLSGCSALMPTKDIESTDAKGNYPNVGEVPQGETKVLTPEEREKMVKELSAARDKNKKAAGVPLPKEQ
jgi:hypothetical protein